MAKQRRPKTKSTTRPKRTARPAARRTARPRSGAGTRPTSAANSRAASATKSRRGSATKASAKSATKSRPKPASKPPTAFARRAPARPAPKSPGASGAAAELRVGFELAARNAAASSGFTFADDCWDGLTGRIAKAVDRLGRDGRTAAGAGRVDEARQNLVRLVDAMVQDAMFRGATQLHEQTLAGALKKLCPLFPFC